MIFYRMHQHLIADWLRLKSLIRVECQLRGFHGNNRAMLERATRDLAKLKQRLLKVSADFKLTVADRAIDQWIKWLQACVKAKGQHFKQFL